MEPMIEFIDPFSSAVRSKQDDRDSCALTLADLSASGGTIHQQQGHTPTQFSPRRQERLPSISELDTNIGRECPDYPWMKGRLERRASNQSDASTTASETSSAPSLSYPSRSGSLSFSASPSPDPFKVSPLTLVGSPWTQMSTGLSSPEQMQRQPMLHDIINPLTILGQRQQNGRRAQPRANSKCRLGQGRCNQKYSLEQKDWILYMRTEMRSKWEDMVEPFRHWFPSEPDRGDSGMQSVYYRMNDKEMPALDADGDAVGDPNREGSYLTQSLKVREGSGRFGLIDRFPERVVQRDYPWVLPEHKAEARRRLARRREKKMDLQARPRWCAEPLHSLH